MSMNNLSVDGEFRYIIQWFNEWSELQRDDFVYVLVEYLTRDTSGNASAGNTYVNGVVNSLATSGVQEKPMSLFQCRIKLFRQWSPKWPIEFKSKLQEKITELDPKVGEKIINELKTTHSMHNGDVSMHLNVNGTSGNGHAELEQTNGDPETFPSTMETQAATITTMTVAAVEADAENGVSDQTLETVNDNHLAAVLRQETPVDDDDADQLTGNDSNADTNGIRALSSSVTTIAVNTSATEQSPLQPQPPQQQQQSQSTIEPVEQVENNVSASVIVSVAAPEILPVA